MKARRIERPSARRYHLANPARTVRQRAMGVDVTLARRALRILNRIDPLPEGHEYNPTDVLLPTRTRPGVVYVQERYLGLPIYDARRAVVLRARGRSATTGSRVVATGLRTLTPARSAEDALRRAAKFIFRSCPRDVIQRGTAFPSTEQFSGFVWGDLAEPTAHLAIFLGGRARLAWVIELGSSGGRRYELVLDAKTLRLLKRRMVSQDVDASLTFSTVAHAIPFDPTWGPETWRRLVCRYEDEKWRPPASLGGVIAAGPLPAGLPDAWSLATLTLASAAFDLLAQAGARLPRTGDTPCAKVYGRAETDEALAAQAFADHVQLRALGSGGNLRHAAEDPTVILHEICHVVLSFNVGGSTLTSPFESFGESGGVCEGLADFLGLTLWNRIARDANPALGDDWLMGKVLLAKPRDYAPYWQAAPPAAPAGGFEIHARGMALCGGLIASLHALSQHQSRSLAEEALWSGLLAALQQAPHHGSLPLFCCITTRVLKALAASAAAETRQAFLAVGLPLVCSHPSPSH